MSIFDLQRTTASILFIRNCSVLPAALDFRRRWRDAGLFPQLPRRFNAGL